jgi:hypothetical protein
MVEAMHDIILSFTIVVVQGVNCFLVNVDEVITMDN